MRISSNGRVTIPATIRVKAGFVPGMEVDIVFDGDGVKIIPTTQPHTRSSGAQIVAHLRARGDLLLSTDELMALTRGD